MHSITTANSFWKRATTPLAWRQFATRHAIWAFWLTIRTNNIIRFDYSLQCWDLLRHWYCSLVSFCTRSFCNITGIPVWTAVLSITTTNSSWQRTTTPLAWRQFATCVVIWALWFTIGTNDTIRFYYSFQCLDLYWNWYKSCVSFGARSLFNITGISVWTAMHSITTANSFWKRTTTPLAWRQFATRHAIWAFWLTIRTNNIIRYDYSLQCWDLLRHWYCSLVAFCTRSFCNITGISVWAAMLSITTANSLGKWTTTPLTWRQFAACGVICTLWLTIRTNDIIHLVPKGTRLKLLRKCPCNQLQESFHAFYRGCGQCCGECQNAVSPWWTTLPVGGACISSRAAMFVISATHSFF